MNEQNSPKHSSLVPSAPRELVAPKVAQNRILCAMVDHSLELAREVTAHLAQNELVRQGKRLLWEDSGGNKGRAAELFRTAALAGHSEAQFLLCRFQDNPEDRFELLKRSAEAGWAEAMWGLGESYENGHYVPKDENEAIKWYKKAAGSSVSAASCGLEKSFPCYSLAKIYENRGDFKQFAEWYQEWAKLDREGMGWIIRYYRTGEKPEAFPQSDAEAAKWCRIGVDIGLGFKADLARLYEKGQGVPCDYAEAVKWYRRAGAWFDLGRCYEYGIGVVADREEAMRCYGKVTGVGLLGRAYVRLRNLTNGHLATDNKQVVGLYQESAEQGDAVSQCCIGSCFDNGIGITRDEASAILWYRLASEQGHVIAQLCLAWRLDVFHSELWPEMIKWYRQAAEHGNPEAQYLLGYKYAEHQRMRGNGGNFVPRDDVEAVIWYRKAAEQGHCQAQDSLGRCYVEGRGVPKDIVLAYAWIRLATESGYTSVKNHASRLASLMTAPELTEAQEIYREFKQKYSLKD
jgi:hypothetical protein